MKVSELSRRSGVSIATIKYYVREGLLPAGRATGPKQAEYDEAHVRRLRLIRALRDVGGLSIQDVGDVVRAIESDRPIHDVFSVVQDAMADVGPEPSTEARAAVDDLLARHQLLVRPDARVRDLLASASETLRLFGWPPDPGWYDARMAEAKEQAAIDLSLVPEGDRVDQVEFTVIGTVALEAMLNAIRRIALEDASARRFGTRG